MYDALQETWKTVTGVTPLTLQNAVASAVQEFVLKGKLNRTITIDGIEYVIPDGYTPLDSIVSSGTQCIDTGLISFKSSYKIEMKMLASEIATKFVFGKNPNTTSNDYGAFTTPQGISFQNGANTRKTVQYSKGNVHTFLFEGDGISIDGTKTTIEPVAEYTINKPLVLLGAYNGGTVDERMLSATLYYAKVKDESETPLRLLFPMKNASNVVGLYDFITNTFKTNAGTGTLTAGAELPNVDNPIGVKGVGEKTDNLFDKDTMGASCNGSLNTRGSISINGTSGTFKIPCEPNTQYTIGFIDELGTTIFRIVTTQNEFVGTAMSTLDHYIGTTQKTYTFTTNENAHWLYIQTNSAKCDDVKNVLMLVKGSNLPTEYIPFGYQIAIKNNNQVVATIYTDELLGDGTYQDTLTLSTQKITRKLGKKVFNGTENWSLNAGVSGLFQLGLPNSLCQLSALYVGLCSHYIVMQNKTASGIQSGECTFQGMNGSQYGRISIRDSRFVGDLVGFKQMVATQYANGTPIVVWYPLATETEEAVEIELSTNAGTNIIDVDAEVKPTASVTYLCTDAN